MQIFFFILTCLIWPVLSGGGNGNPLQYSCLESPLDGGAWYTRVHGVAKSRTQLRDFTFTFTLNCWGGGCVVVVGFSLDSFYPRPAFS